MQPPLPPKPGQSDDALASKIEEPDSTSMVAGELTVHLADNHAVTFTGDEWVHYEGSSVSLSYGSRRSL